MGLNFLQQHGARRMREYQPQPIFVNGSPTVEEEDDEDETTPRARPNVILDIEAVPAQWQPVRVSHCGAWNDFEEWNLRPRRFIDGKDVGRTVAWLQTEEGYPVPIRLSVIGAISLQNQEGCLKREWSAVERVVTMATACFPVEQINEFQDSLEAHDFRLLPVPCPPEGLGFDFEVTNGRTRKRSRYEMNLLEKQAMQFDGDTPMIVDGRLDSHSGAFDAQTTPVLGLVKSHHQQYLENHATCWNTLYALEPGERTPVFAIKNPNLDVASWYVRMCGANGEMPNWGIVRLEVPLPFFESLGAEQSTECINRWSRLICEYRCRDESYGRSAVSIHPIVRAEQSLGAMFTPLDTLVHKFYRLTNI
jgi:hypothetical protein